MAIVRRLIDHFEAHGEALDLDTLLPLAERDWVDGLHRVMPASFDFPEGAAGAFTEGTFYPAFLQDLARARESIVIFSPFATGPGTGALGRPTPRGAGARCARSHPHSAPRGVGRRRDRRGGRAGETRCATSASTVDLRARMHEKIAILDGRILWHGSLNILSHRDTHESMLRLESPAACSQLARFVSTPAGRRDDAQALDVQENPECPKCGGPTVWNNGRFGIYFECEGPDCDGKVDARRAVRLRCRRWRRTRNRTETALRSRLGIHDGCGRPTLPEAGVRRPSRRAQRPPRSLSWAARTTPAAGTPRIWSEGNGAS